MTLRIALALALLHVALSSSPARADLDHDDPPVVPTVALGLGGGFPLAPRSDAHLIGSAVAGAQIRLTAVDHRRVALLADLGYSGDRRGYLAGRHLVVGTGLRYGTVFGAAWLVQGVFGRTGGERSLALRTGVRVDVRNYLGFSVLFESRHVADPAAADLIARGMRFEFFFDPIRFAYRIHQLGGAISDL